MNKLPNDPPVLLFELGNIQVFHYPTHYEKLSNAAPTAVYWQDSVTKTTYGPFMSIYATMNHFTYLTCMYKAANTPGNNVVFMDFRNKRRIKLENQTI